MRLDRINIPYNKMIEVFEEILFKGCRHFKRQTGITIFPWERFPRKKTRLRIERFFQLIKYNINNRKNEK